MAVHASLGRRNPGNGGSFDASMTVAAIDAVIAHVMLVAELHGLLTGNVLSRHIGRARHREHGYERHSDEKEGRKHTEPRDELGTAMKNLCHVCSALCGGALRVGSCGQGVPRVSRKVQTRIMLDAIVSNKTFGNATFRQFVIHGFQNFRRLLFAVLRKKARPLEAPCSDQQWCLRSAVATPSVSPIPMPNGIIFREISERHRWSSWDFF